MEWMNHKLCNSPQCPHCNAVPIVLREAILDIQSRITALDCGKNNSDTEFLGTAVIPKRDKKP